MLLRRSGVLVITGLPSLEAWEGGKPQRQTVSHDTVAMALGCWRNWCSDVDGEAEREPWGGGGVLMSPKKDKERQLSKSSLPPYSTVKIAQGSI